MKNKILGGLWLLLCLLATACSDEAYDANEELADFGDVEQPVTVATNTGSSQVLFAGGRQFGNASTPFEIRRCHSGTSGNSSCTTGSAKLIVPISSNITIGVQNVQGTVAERQQLHAIASASCFLFQQAAALPGVVTCSMIPLNNSCTQSGNPAMICLRANNAGTGSGQGLNSDFSTLACGTVASTGTTSFHTVNREVSSCRSYNANVAVGKVNAMSLTAQKKADTIQQVINYVIASAMVGGNGQTTTSSNQLINPNSPIPAFSMTSGEKCRISVTNGLSNPGIPAFSQTCSGT